MASADSNIQVAGTALDAFGTYLSNKEQARGFTLNASEVLREGKLAAARMREMGERVQSSQRVGFAKGGVEISGTALEVMVETVQIAERDALEIERSARLRARELKRAANRKEGAGIGSVLGMAVGAYFGGPAGAAAGAQLGGAIGAETA